MSAPGGRLAGRSVAITGATSGIGRATARRALVEGAVVAAIDLDAGGLRDLAAESGERRDLLTIGADVVDAASIDGAIGDAAARAGGLDVVFANAGTGMDPTPVMDIDLGVWNTILATNLSGVFFTLRAGVPHLRRRGGGLLLATASSLALRPGIGMHPYVAAKAGVHNLVRSLALELAPEGIRAVVIAPGLTETPMTRAREGYIERGLASVPTGRLVDVDDVAALAVHLMTDESSSITGSVFVVDAGLTAV